MYYALKQPIPHGVHVHISANPKEVLQQVRTVEARIYQVEEASILLPPVELKNLLFLLDEQGSFVSVKEALSRPREATVEGRAA